MKRPAQFDPWWHNWPLALAVAVGLALGIAGLVQGQTVLNTATPQIFWDAVSVSGLPPTAAISYDYGTKLSPATVPTLVGNTSLTSATYNLGSTYGIYALCARTVLKNNGVVQEMSEWSCSDIAAVCRGGQTFLDSFWPVLPTVSGMRPATP